MLFDSKSILKLTDTKWFLMNSNAYVFPRWKKHLPNLMMQYLFQLLMATNWLVKEYHCKLAILNRYYIYNYVYAYVYIYISYFNCEISSHLKLATRWVDLNLNSSSLCMLWKLQTKQAAQWKTSPWCELRVLLAGRGRGRVHLTLFEVLVNDLWRTLAK